MAEHRAHPVAVRRIILFVVASAATVAFWELAEGMSTEATLGFDTTVLAAVQSMRSPAMDVAMRLITSLGSYLVIGPVVLATAWRAARTGSRSTAAVVIITAVVAESLNLGLKLMFARPRPDLFEARRLATYSFPSGHAMVSLVVYGTVAAIIGRLQPVARTVVVLVTIVMVGFVGASRVYLGVHYPIDVVAGFMAGIPLLVASLLSLPKWPRDPRPT